MAKYIDGFVLTIPKNKIKEYRSIAKKVGAVWRKYGALEYIEAMGDDMHPKDVAFTFPKMAKAKPNEVVFFSFIVYKSRAHRDAVNKKVMKDPMTNKPMPMPFDMKRFAYGGFSAIVEA